MFDRLIRFKARLHYRHKLRQMIKESNTIDKSEIDWKFIKQMEDSMVNTYMEWRNLCKPPPPIYDDEQKVGSVE